MPTSFDQGQLPASIHADTLTTEVRATGEQIAYAVVWADRDDETCPQCGAHIERVIGVCPVVINTEVWELQPLPQQHSRGYWLTVWWVGFRVAGAEPTPAEFAIGLSILISDLPVDRADRLAALVAGNELPALPQPRGAHG